MAETIVVGIDGSPGADAALRWAIQEARLRHAEIRAIHAWTYPHLADLSYLASASVDRDMLASGAKEILDEAVQRVLGEADDLMVQTIVAEGPAPMVLADASAHADLVVVGTRGRGGFTELVLGSTSHQLAHHVRCPLVIVPPQR